MYYRQISILLSKDLFMCVLPMRCILLVLDGLGDKGLPCFEGKTPLQMAVTPNLDHLASLGMNGLYHSYLQGSALPSELAHFIMFGYDIETFPGRGPIEAIGESIPLKNGEVALLARIFSVSLQDGNLILKKENPTLDIKTCRALQEAIQTFQDSGVEIEFVPTKGVEGILLLRGNVSAKITDSNPIFEERPLMEISPLKVLKKRSARFAPLLLSIHTYGGVTRPSRSIHSILRG